MRIAGAETAEKATIPGRANIAQDEVGCLQRIGAATGTFRVISSPPRLLAQAKQLIRRSFHLGPELPGPTFYAACPCSANFSPNRLHLRALEIRAGHGQITIVDCAI
jgi:hypothetical protein